MKRDPLKVGRFVEVKGKQVFYREAGTGDPIILLHGFPTSSYDWRKFLVPLKAFGRVIAPDLYGFGYSDPPARDGPTASKLASFLDDFVSAMGINKSTLIAYDIGGPLALRYAIENPTSVSRLILMNMTIYPEWAEHVRTSPSYSRVRRMAGSGLYRTIAVTFLNRKRVKQIIAPNPAVVMSPEDLDEYVFFVRRAIRNMVTLYSEASLKIGEETRKNLVDKVHGLDVPTLILSSENDPFISPEVARRLNGDIKASKLTILENTGHFLLEEKPERVSELITRFLAS